MIQSERYNLQTRTVQFKDQKKAKNVHNSQNQKFHKKTLKEPEQCLKNA